MCVTPPSTLDGLTLAHSVFIWFARLKLLLGSSFAASMSASSFV